jgi:hypothetical protein
MRSQQAVGGFTLFDFCPTNEQEKHLEQRTAARHAGCLSNTLTDPDILFGTGRVLHVERSTNQREPPEVAGALQLIYLTTVCTGMTILIHISKSWSFARGKQ